MSRYEGLSGSDLRNQSRSGKRSQYRIRLEEKQKLRFHYGITEDNYLNTFVSQKSQRVNRSSQLVNHRHILVNGRIVDIPSLCCKPQDTIMSRDEQKSKALIQNSLDSSSVRNCQTFDSSPIPYKGLVNQIIDSKWVGLKINELLVVEYYSRQT
ncbi:30S ribosomal protein S4 chloroplastic [Bienertia sinuspersici]